MESDTLDNNKVCCNIRYIKRMQDIINLNWQEQMTSDEALL